MKIDVAFALRGSEIPADHGYPLFSAVSRVIPFLHGEETSGIHPIAGTLIGNRLLRLTERSRLVLRVDSTRVKDLMPLAGKRLDVEGHAVVLGTPSPAMLRPAPSLRSRLVVIKGFMEPEPFVEACKRQLASLGVAGAATIPLLTLPTSVEGGENSAARGPHLRRTIRIHDKVVVGFAVRVDGLNDADSVRLQSEGIGGRRRFGCGVFVASADRKVS